jgi:reactive intermediate/imine deaminase
LKKILVNPKELPPPISKYSHGVTIENNNMKLIFISGQMAIDQNGEIVGVKDIAKQTDYVFKEIKNILKESGASLKDVVKATIFITNMNEYQKVADVRNKYFSESPPATSLVEVNRLVKDGCLVEIEAIAAISK